MTRNTYDPHMLKETPEIGLPGRLSRWRHALIDSVDREMLERQLIDNGGLSWSYIFLVITSCAIATLGLMLNSGDVIIGAMLVAPLMGPIVLLGYAIARTNVLLGIRSAKALAVGVMARWPFPSPSSSCHLSSARRRKYCPALIRICSTCWSPFSPDW